MCALTDGRGHDMQVYAGTDALLDELAVLFELELRRGDAIWVIGTGEVCDGLGAPSCTRMECRRPEPPALSRHRRRRCVQSVHAERASRRDPSRRDRMELEASEPRS
jgi:hypothetical protein